MSKFDSKSVQTPLQKGAREILQNVASVNEAGLPASSRHYLHRWIVPRVSVIAIVAYVEWSVQWYTFVVIPPLVLYLFLVYQDYFSLEQWPNPSGPYYTWWLKHESNEDYYAWLSRIHGHYRPWCWWAIDEKLPGCAPDEVVQKQDLLR